MLNNELKEIPLIDIVPDNNQPRSLPSYNELVEQVESGNRRAKEIWGKLLELATSILEVGLEQPITVYPASRGSGYIIYDGHRRFLASRILAQQGHGNGKILCHVRISSRSEIDTLLGQINVNMQRDDLNVFELARSLNQLYKQLKEAGGEVQLVDESGHIQTIEIDVNEKDDVVWGAIEKKVGIGRSRRYQVQAVLKLPPRIQQIAEEEALPESRLRFVIPIKDERIQEIMVREIAEKDLPNAAIKKRIVELQKEFVAEPVTQMPKPAQIQSVIRPARALAKKVSEVKNVQSAISNKDPRTVDSYREVIPELQAVIEDLNKVLEQLMFLES